MKHTLYITVVALLSFGSTLAQNQNIQFIDDNFKQALIAEGVDVDKNGEISYDEAKSVTVIDIAGKMVSQMPEIQYFTNLEKLVCYSNQLTDLNVKGLINLQHLDCAYNQLTTLDVNGLINLQYLDCEFNHLTNLNVSGLINLQYLYCDNNQLTTLNVSGLTDLISLFCHNNQLTTLNVSGLTNLQNMNCHNNQLTTLNVSGLTNLQDLWCGKNDLIMIDLRQTSLHFLDANFNPLQCVIIDSGDKPADVFGVPVSLYTTEPCLATFETLTHLVKNSDLMNYQRNILLTTMQSAEGLCALGSKEAATLMLWTMAGTVQLWQKWGAIAPDVALEIKEAINLLIDGIQSGDVDCSPDFSPDNDLWDGFSSWFNLDDSPHTGNGSYVTTHTLSPATTVRLYPNPTKGMVNLSQPAQDVHVYNLLGQHLFQARNVNHLDLSAYQPGVYVIRIGNGRDGSVHRVIRQ